VDGLHVEGVAEHERDLVLSTEVGDPVPGKHAFDADDEPIAERLDGAEQGFGPGRQLAVEVDGAVVIEDTQVHTSGMQIDSAIKSMGRGVETHGELLGLVGA
jgi:hypothetical protein